MSMRGWETYAMSTQLEDMKKEVHCNASDGWRYLHIKVESLDHLGHLGRIKGEERERNELVVYLWLLIDLRHEDATSWLMEQGISC